MCACKGTRGPISAPILPEQSPILLKHGSRRSSIISSYQAARRAGKSACAGIPGIFPVIFPVSHVAKCARRCSLMEGKTAIAIAHRLSTIASMGRLLVLDEAPYCRARHARCIAWAWRPVCSRQAGQRCRGRWNTKFHLRHDRTMMVCIGSPIRICLPK